MAVISVLALAVSAIEEDGRQRIAELFDGASHAATEPVKTVEADTANDIAELYSEISRIRSETRMLTLEKDAIATKLAAMEDQIGPYTASLPDDAEEVASQAAARSEYPPMPATTRDIGRIETAFSALPIEQLSEAAPDAIGEQEIDRELAALTHTEVHNGNTGASATHFAVELAQAKNLEEIKSAWERLLQEMPEAMAKLTPGIVMTESGEELRLRLIAGPFPNAAEARRMCARLETRDVACEPVSDEGMRLVMQ